MKKRVLALIVAIAAILIVGIAYFFRPDQTEAPGKPDSAAGRSDPLPAWVDPQDVTAVEWEGKRTSWLLQRTDSNDGAGEGGWSLNGKPAAESDAMRVLSQMNLLWAKGAAQKQPVSSLKDEIIDSTVTVAGMANTEETVYLIAAAPSDPNRVWIIPSGASFAYPVFVKDLELLEGAVDRLKSADPSA